MRTLIHFPIVHHPIELLAQEDYDTLCHAIPDRINKFNERYDQCWKQIDAYLKDRVVHKVYQDSHWGEASEKIMRERRSRNDQQIFHIAKTITDTLQEEETSVLFVGKAHTLFRIPLFRIQTETYDPGFDTVYNSPAALHWLGKELALRLKTGPKLQEEETQ